MLFSSIFSGEKIEFLCHADDLGVIAEPYPARKNLPKWFRDLEPKVGGENRFRNSTIKRCAPFLDALCAGWIIPLAADVEILTNDDASGVTYQWRHHRAMVENHSVEQVRGHPRLPRPPMKFLNWWLMKVPPGVSILFVPPLNRDERRFQCVSGIVDADRYFEFINFPFFFLQGGFTGIIERGTPLVQAIPIRRSALQLEAPCRAMSPSDLEELSLTRRRVAAHESHYRDERWIKK